MTKPTLLERVKLLNGGRTYYLEFLRNLTPQIVLLSIALLLGRTLDLTRFDSGNWVPTTLFFVLLGAFALAFYANSTLFYENCFPEWKEWLRKTKKSVAIQGAKGPGNLLATLNAVCRYRFIEFVEVAVTIYFLQIALAVVVFMGMQSASTILQSHSATRPCGAGVLVRQVVARHR